MIKKISVIKTLLVVLLLFTSKIWVYSQNSQLFHIPDSLKTKTYKDLFEGLNSSYNDTLKEKIYAEAYLHKAKNENDTIKIANAYSQFATINNTAVAIKYCDSIIELTKTMDHFVYPGFGYMTKGMIYYKNGNDHKALEYYLKAYAFANRHNNYSQLAYLKSGIGDIKTFWGKNKEALLIFKSLLKQLDSLDENKISNQNSLYLRTLFSLTNSFILDSQLDSANFYVNLGIQKSLNHTDSLMYYNFVSQAGHIAYYQNEFDRAIDSLDKTLPYEYSSNGFLNDHYYRGNIYWKQAKDSLAFYHFKKADSIYNLTNDVVPEVRDIQEYFINYYKKNNDIKNQLKYINRLLYVDSILTYNYKNLNETLVKKYDTPLLLSEKQQIIAGLKTKELKASFTIYILIALGLISILFFIWYFRKQRILKERFKLIILNKEVISKQNIKTPKKELTGISEKIIISVLKALEEFENNKVFLDNEITLNGLSKLYSTNSNYLSKIINTHKEKNFSTYISDLRIDYCIEKLKKDTTFRKFSIKAIAYEIGFNNSESFSKAFFKKTGIYPSYFIKELEK